MKLDIRSDHEFRVSHDPQEQHGESECALSNQKCSSFLDALQRFGINSTLCDEFQRLFFATTKVKCLSDAGLFLDASRKVYLLVQLT
ncbi:hypothetical protein Scep_029542 [Stephania cephalantha]|uniref:Uncharacterized protein n=1 Tax=Stephania cephalantha TaxID=152367 RepID=A0AAP0HFZ2_9MAGN